MEELQIIDNSFNKGFKKEKKLNDYEITVYSIIIFN